MISPLVVDHRGEEERGDPRSGRQGGGGGDPRSGRQGAGGGAPRSGHQGAAHSGGRANNGVES